MEDILNRVLFGSVTVMHVLIGAAVIFVVLVVIPKLFAKKERPDVFETVRCLECGWGGQVSKYHRTCRKCNGTTLEKIG